VRTRLQIACLCGTVLILNGACGGTRSTVSDETQSTATAPAPPETPGNPREATAVIAQNEASFTIPVGRRAVWRWNRPETPPSHREYQWDISSPNASFGFSLFRDPDSVPKEGPLDSLLAAGQVSVWEGLPNGAGQLMRGSQGYLSSPGGSGIYAKARTDGSAISIIISDKTAIARLFAAKPAVVEVVARAPGAPEQRYSVPVSYQGR